MKIIHTTALTDQQKNQVRSLVEICKQKNLYLYLLHQRMVWTISWHMIMRIP